MNYENFLFFLRNILLYDWNITNQINKGPALLRGFHELLPHNEKNVKVLQGPPRCATFLVWKFYRNAQFLQSFWWFAGRFPHQEIRCLYSISCKVFCNFFTLTLRKIRLFHLTSSCGSIVERHNFRIVSGDLLEIMPKLCLSTKFPHQEIRWNDDISRSVTWRNCSFQISMLRKYF